jgi:Mg2+/Co2+ transporter CorC
MEESLANVEFLRSSNSYIARIQSELGGLREYRSATFEEVLEQVIIDLQEEFESAL